MNTLYIVGILDSSANPKMSVMWSIINNCYVFFNYRLCFLINFLYSSFFMNLTTKLCIDYSPLFIWKINFYENLILILINHILINASSQQVRLWYRSQNLTKIAHRQPCFIQLRLSIASDLFSTYLFRHPDKDIDRPVLTNFSRRKFCLISEIQIFLSSRWQ